MSAAIWRIRTAVIATLALGIPGDPNLGADEDEPELNPTKLIADVLATMDMVPAGEES